ncbi:MAG: ATP-binding protein [Candidatus Competibacter sp.]|nr:ATP-binding protein [Candidatus Competibacter sp.]MDG4584230.1 ATP-binding protein [Candidatus Competibacter sp.]
MLEALRGLGYSTATALADLIDNSIAARAETVHLRFLWAGPASAIHILDDGDGMDAGELDRAMRLGERSPLDLRAAHDLGRFGLGLKTASLSQCRRLTVASRRDGKTHCLRWDLDEIARRQDDGWYLLEDAAEGSAAHLRHLEEQERGTLVLWEVLDRIVTPEFREQDFLDLIDRVEQHLAMVFHRYLQGPNPRLRILINECAVAPWNPFLTNHPATWSSPVQRYPSAAGLVEVQGHVLPHRDRLEPDDYEQAGGPEGWTAQQGFYVYRNERLLAAGGWLGLGQGRGWTREEAQRLARIRIDIPNSADADWKIDIRKSTARPPVALRKRLLSLAEDIRQRARRVFAHRGRIIQVSGKEPLAEAWQTEQGNGGMRYRISEDHPAIKAVLESAGPLLPQIRAMLRVIEETVPVQRIWLDTTEGREVPRTGFAGEAPAEVVTVLEVMFRNMIQRKGLSPHLAREQLLRTEPFHQYPDLVRNLPDILMPE